MSFEWSIQSLGGAPIQIIDGDRGKNYPKQHEFSAEGHCLFLNAGNVTSDGFSFSDCMFIDAEKDALLRKGKLNKGDIVLTTRGTVGNVAFYSNEIPYQNIRINSGMVIIRPDSLQLDPYFLYLFLRSTDFHYQVKSLTSGSAQPQLPIRDLIRVEMVIPPLQEQLKIVNVLKALDDRITLLRETNATLEAIAQALFKSWFVDFDPVHANAHARAQHQNSHPQAVQQNPAPHAAEANAQNLGLDAATAALFPDHFQDSDLGPIPAGWRVVPFIDTISIIGGGTPKTSIEEYWNGDIPWFSVVDAPADTDVFVVDTEKYITQLGLNNSSTKILPEGTTIISARGTVGRLALVGREMAMNQSCYGLRGKSDDAYFTYFSTYRLVDVLKQNAHGSVFDTITRDTFSGVSIVYPSKEVIAAFETKLGAVMENIRNNIFQAQTLTQLRDTLLPRLISGQLRLPDAEAQIEAVVGGA